MAGPVDMLSHLLHPAVQALLVGLLAVLCVVARRPRAALAAGLFAIAWVWVASSPAVALHLRQGLVTPASPAPARADAIVVLGGGKLPDGPWALAGSRAGTGLGLWREGYAPILLVSGSDQARTLAAGYTISGVPPADLRIEAKSRNTHENALNTAALLRADGRSAILLVTSPIHMRRAAASFRHEGIQVSAVPAADDDRVLLTDAAGWLPRREALTLTARCLREYVALWVYGHRGWIRQPDGHGQA
ncbi:YdcF family protein [Bacillus sp. NP157]|nr:YdcF family protein [Bacillus sp. NP157]